MAEPNAARHRAYLAWKAAVKQAHQQKVGFYRPWREAFANFLADMGDPPAGAKLIRKDRGGPFTPENCQWLV